MGIFELYVYTVLGWEATALLTGPRWPPTITEWVRRADGWHQAVLAVLLVLPAFGHLVEWIA